LDRTQNTLHNGEDKGGRRSKDGRKEDKVTEKEKKIYTIHNKTEGNRTHHARSFHMQVQSMQKQDDSKH